MPCACRGMHVEVRGQLVGVGSLENTPFFKSHSYENIHLTEGSTVLKNSVVSLLYANNDGVCTVRLDFLNLLVIMGFQVMVEASSGSKLPKTDKYSDSSGQQSQYSSHFSLSYRGSETSQVGNQ